MVLLKELGLVQAGHRVFCRQSAFSFAVWVVCPVPDGTGPRFFFLTLALVWGRVGLGPWFSGPLVLWSPGLSPQ